MVINTTVRSKRNKSKKILILAIDGGGTKSIYAASIIHNIEQKYNIKLFDCFDYFIGTSSGSIVAAALAMNIPMMQVLNMFHESTERVISSQHHLVGLFMASYNKKVLRNSLCNLFHDTTLQKIKKPLAITLSNITSAQGYISRSYGKDLELCPRNKCLLVDVITAACAAPTYFSPHKIHNTLFADGALWCNNPAQEAVNEVISLYNTDIKHIKVLSLGAGREPLFYKTSDYNQNWGIIKWGSKLIDIMLALQMHSTHVKLKQLLPRAQYLRINFEYHRYFDLLDTEMIKKCELWGKINFKHQKTKIKQFLFS